MPNHREKDVLARAPRLRDREGVLLALFMLSVALVPVVGALLDDRTFGEDESIGFILLIGSLWLIFEELRRRRPRRRDHRAS